MSGPASAKKTKSSSVLDFAQHHPEDLLRELEETREKLRILVELRNRNAEERRELKSTARLFERGLPRLVKDTTRIGTMPQSQSKSSASPATILKRKFSPCQKSFKDYSPFESFILLRQMRAPGHTLTYEAEPQVQSLVESFLYDMLSASGMNSELTVGREITLQLLQPSDVLVLRASDKFGYKYPVCCIEVKRPGTDLNDPLVIGQLRDYLLQLRTMYGLVDVVGMLTSYDETRIVWLPDCQPLASAPDILNGENKPSPGIIARSSVPAGEIAVLHGTKVIRYDDLQLPQLIASLFHKVASPRWIVRPLVNKDGQLHPCISPLGISWETKRLDCVKLEFPRSTTTKFTLLSDFRFGNDGRVWLTCSDSGNMAVLKFLLQGDPTEPDSTERLCEEESSLWGTIYDVPARSVVFAGINYAIVMPYCVTCYKNLDPVTNGVTHSFRPQLRAQRAANCERLSDEDEIYLNDKEVIALLAALDPGENMAREAVDRMVTRGYVHCDVHWRHVAALPVWSQKGEDCGEPAKVVGFRGVFIDLSYVRTLKEKKLSAEEARAKMLAKLGLQ